MRPVQDRDLFTNCPLALLHSAGQFLVDEAVDPLLVDASSEPLAGPLPVALGLSVVKRLEATPPKVAKWAT
jgi:hypothetical protein